MADPLRVIGADGEQIGVLSLREALSYANEAGLDLIEISPKATPPVCKIADYGKFKFQEQKKAAEAKKKQVTVTVKEISLRPRIEDHDFNIKMRKAREFIADSNKVKVSLRFRGREVTHQNIGIDLLNRVEETLSDVAKVDFKSGLEGRFMTMILSPGAAKKPKVKEPAPAPKAAAAPAETPAEEAATTEESTGE